MMGIETAVMRSVLAWCSSRCPLARYWTSWEPVVGEDHDRKALDRLLQAQLQAGAAVHLGEYCLVLAFEFEIDAGAGAGWCGRCGPRGLPGGRRWSGRY